MIYTIEEMKDHAALCASIEAATGGTFEGKSGVIIDLLLSRIEVLEKDVFRYKLRLETIRALYPSAPSDRELDTAIDAAMQSEKGENK